ncbi:hypothetical protein NDU88_007191 [Pleurodeles waltl]|uniref:Uncharacterized protein n=1 Tax=Pleurodeles waltl TaxID=8319 RepID=A0AAV7QQW0_PLEWA|nr:hypothetical protein NDU88_007191 [Pleurodeles waltl]
MVPRRHYCQEDRKKRNERQRQARQLRRGGVRQRGDQGERGEEVRRRGAVAKEHDMSGKDRGREDGTGEVREIGKQLKKQGKIWNGGEEARGKKEKGGSKREKKQWFGKWSSNHEVTRGGTQVTAAPDVEKEHVKGRVVKEGVLKERKMRKHGKIEYDGNMGRGKKGLQGDSVQ